ncbi:polysaccharide deacetylase family protein [Krasilnikovia sp. M28-CT-15]|uniref:polysaccharide deacetylase family protein n=1 Tax=Krasilnikovia sp. M28-CT-15 TaxID=3373540 RepID=UPI00399C9F48
MALVAAITLAVTAGCHSPGSPAVAARARPSSASTPGPAQSPQAAQPGAANPFAGKLPTFGPLPAPHPIALPGGPIAPIYQRLPVDQPVAFLTMDDGQTQLAQAHELMQAANIPFTMFLIAPVAGANPSFFQRLTASGGVIEDHTLTHRSLRGRPYEFQRQEICGAKTSLEQTFGTTVRFFRPPYGNYDRNTLKAVHDCGLQAAFYWSETVNNGKVRYQTPLHRIQPGDIILMHFRPGFIKDVTAALRAIHDAGLTPALLEDYLR